VTSGSIAIDAGAPNGQAGWWLIDPNNFDIDAIAAANIAGALSTGTSVTVSTADINVNGTIAKTAGGDANLVLQADRRVAVQQDISSTSGKLNLVLWSGRGSNLDGGVSVSGAITTNGGHFWAGGTRTLGGTSTWNGLTVGNGAATGFASGSANAFDFTGSVTTSVTCSCGRAAPVPAPRAV
jgi:hypothetical protein